MSSRTRSDTTGRIAGIDLGSQLAGTTVICRGDRNSLTLTRSKRKEHADTLIIEQFEALPPHLIGIDAPLSLPGIYRGLRGCTDYQFRAVDRKLKAMSPMFIGGLTARAIQLRNKLEAFGHKVIEVYPAALLRELSIESSYKRSPALCNLLLKKLRRAYSLPSISPVKSSHEVDSVLAYLSAQRFLRGEAKIYGEHEEGLIVI